MQARLADDRAHRADGDFLAGMRHDDHPAFGRTQLQMAAFLRCRMESMSLQHIENLLEPGRLGIRQLLSHTHIADFEIVITRILQIELNSLLELADGLFARGAEAGDIDIEALSDPEFFLAVQAVLNGLHAGIVSLPGIEIKEEVSGLDG